MKEKRSLPIMIIKRKDCEFLFSPPVGDMPRWAITLKQFATFIQPAVIEDCLVHKFRVLFPCFLGQNDLQVIE